MFSLFAFRGTSGYFNLFLTAPLFWGGGGEQVLKLLPRFFSWPPEAPHMTSSSNDIQC